MMHKPKIYVTTAGIAAELYHAANIAKEVTLIAKNARVISMRAGERAIGFKPITVFINEFADNTIEQANKINQLAILISKISIKKSHAENALQRFHNAWLLAGEDSHRADITPIRDRITNEVYETDGQIKKLFQLLIFELEQTEMQIRASVILSTSSKTEASRAGEFQQSLDVIAKSIEDTAASIRNHLRIARKSLAIHEV
jgi:hypothetical protein